jgi:hypothetical protein
VSDADRAAVRALADAATVFALELASPEIVGCDESGRLDRATALATLASRADHRPDLLQRTRASIDVADGAEVDDLLATAALWAAFTGDA